jgi:uncharacterized coiled-coil protein SlyX
MQRRSCVLVELNPQTNQCPLDSKRTLGELTIQKQSALLRLCQIQEQKLLTLKELAFLNEFAIEGSVSRQQLKPSKASDESPWDPHCSDIDGCTYLNVMRRQERKNQWIAFAVSIKNEISQGLELLQRLIYIYQWEWIYSQLCQSNWMRFDNFENSKSKQSAPPSSDQEDRIGEMVDTLTETEEDIQSCWNQMRVLEENLDVCIQRISRLLREEYAPPYRTLAEFREYIAAARGSEHRAGRPSLLFSSSPPILRDSFSRRKFWGPLRLSSKVCEPCMIPAQTTGKSA